MTRKRPDLPQCRPIYWYNKASDLLGAAGALWASQDAELSRTLVERLGLGSSYSMAAAISPVYLMLCGLALELLYKAIIVAKGLRVDTNHKLVDFAAQAGLDLSDKEQGLLEILSESVIWAGRYPVAKDFKYMAKLRELKAEHLFDLTPLGKMTIATPNNALNWVSFKELWDRGAELYWQHHSDQ